MSTLSPYWEQRKQGTLDPRESHFVASPTIPLCTCFTSGRSSVWGLFEMEAGSKKILEIRSLTLISPLKLTQQKWLKNWNNRQERWGTQVSLHSMHFLAIQLILISNRRKDKKASRRTPTFGFLIRTFFQLFDIASPSINNSWGIQTKFYSN